MRCTKQKSGKKTYSFLSRLMDRYDMGIFVCRQTGVRKVMKINKRNMSVAGERHFSGTWADNPRYGWLK